MNSKIHVTCLALFSLATPLVHGQARSTATQTMQLSVFGGVTGTYTGLEAGKNLGITAGADLRFHSIYNWNPSLEIRGTSPVFHKGGVDSQENILAGLKVDRTYGRFHPYADLLFGRGQINYQSGGYPDLTQSFYYVQTPSNVFSPGIGVDYTLNDRFSVKADAQFQHYDTPVTTSGSLYAKPLTLGVVYRFDFNPHHHRRR